MNCASAIFLVVLAVGAAPVAAATLRSSNNTVTASSLAAGVFMHLTPHRFFEVKLGPFGSAAEACNYCQSSFTKTGQPPAGPINEMCVCMSYPGDGGHEMFCSAMQSAAKYVAEKDGCRCEFRDMEAMGKTTCA